VRVDYPAQGWVTVYWGEVGLVQTDPVPVYGLVPEGVLFISPEGATEYMRLEPGDSVSWDIDPATGQPRGTRNRTLPDEQAQHNRDLAMRIRALMDDYQDGIITREEYHELLNEVLNDALGLGDAVVVPEEEQAWDITPLAPMGGLYGGEFGGQVVNLCFDGRYVTRITWSTELQCVELESGEEYTRWYIFDVVDAIMVVDTSGNFGVTYPVDPALSVNTYVVVEGNISSGGGSVELYAQSESDVEFCGTNPITLPLNSTGAECTE